MSNLEPSRNVDRTDSVGTGPARQDERGSEASELSEWMVKYSEGDADAFSALFSNLYPAIYRFHLGSIKRPEVAEDLTQKTFLKLHVARRRYRKGAPVKPWVFTIAKNVQRDLFRRQRRSREQLIEETDYRWAHYAGDEQPQRDMLMQRKLKVAIQSLPEGQRDVILLHKFEGLSMEEVASTLQIGVSAAKVRAHRGYASLRRSLDESAQCAAA